MMLSLLERRRSGSRYEPNPSVPAHVHHSARKGLAMAAKLHPQVLQQCRLLRGRHDTGDHSIERFNIEVSNASSPKLTSYLYGFNKMVQLGVECIKDSLVVSNTGAQRISRANAIPDFLVKHCYDNYGQCDETNEFVSNKLSLSLSSSYACQLK